MKKLIGVLFIGLFAFQMAHSQVGVGLTASWDTYQRYTNPDDVQYDAAGSFLLNFGLGPKIWVGGDRFSVSAEAQANLGLAGLAVKDYKGLGIVSFPLIANLNFGGMSALDKEGKIGFSLGGGLQYNRTELYYQSSSFKDAGGDRSLFKTYVAQAAVGFGMSGFTGGFYVRYGWDPASTGANTVNLGLKFDFNIPKLKGITNPESDL